MSLDIFYFSWQASINIIIKQMQNVYQISLQKVTILNQLNIKIPLHSSKHCSLTKNIN